MEKALARGILVVDPDPEFLASITKDIRNSRVPSYTASSLRDAQLLIADKSKPLMALFINPILPTVFEPAVIKHAHHYRPSTPIYLLHDNPLPLSAHEFEKIGVQKLFRKPLSYSQIVDIADPPRFRQTLALAHATSEEVGAEIEASDSNYKAIRAGDFVSGSKSFFDIYVQLRAGRFLKIVKAGDEFDPERVVTYIQKGVKYFYIRKEAQESYLMFCDQITKHVVEKSGVDNAAKVSQVLNLGEEVISFFKTTGITESTLQYANNYVVQVYTAIEGMGLNRFDGIKKFMQDAANLEHGNACAMMASLMMKPLKFSDPDTISAVGLACIFHDLGLQEMPEKLKKEDIVQMNEEELALYHTHSHKGAAQLAEFKTVSEAVIQAVQQHHERRTRKGFPNGLGAGSINGIAEIVGICDEFVNALKRARENQVNPFHYMETRVYDGFSANVVEAFREGVMQK